MNISDLQKKLEDLKLIHGDIPVKVETLTHTFDPYLVVKGALSATKIKYLVLNG